LILDPSGTGSWRIFLANSQYSGNGPDATAIITQSPGLSVADTTLGDWPSARLLWSYLLGDPSVLAWQACEHVQVAKAHFFAGFNGDGIAITRMVWSGNNFVITYPDLAGADQSSGPGGIRFFVADLRPGAPSVRFVIDSPGPISP
jgi:hypothetical protein